MDGEPSRGEFEMLKSIVVANQERLNSIDDSGTKGVAVVQSQLTELVKDVGELKGDVTARFSAHQRVHEQDQQQRRESRRWLVGVGLAGVATMATVIGLLIDVLARLH